MKELQVNIQDSVLINSLPEIQLQRIQKEFKSRELSVMHIGGYDGLFDINLSKQFKNIQIHTIEACPKNYKFLKRITKNYTNIIPHNNCISNIDGKINFYLFLRKELKDNKLSSQSNSIYSNFLSGKEKQDIVTVSSKSLTITSFCAKYKIKRLDLLRINCEGGEFSIFQKSSDMSFLEYTNIIHIFIHGKSINFLNKKRMHAKSFINQMIKKYGFELLYGYDLTKTDKYSVGHVQQIWIRKNYV